MKTIFKSLCVLFVLCGEVFADAPGTTQTPPEEASTWGGRLEHPAIVNPVLGDEQGSVLSLRGEWDFTTRSGSRNGVWKHWYSMPEWPDQRKIQVPGSWEAQGIGEPGMSARWDNGGDHNAKPIRHKHVSWCWYRKTVEIPAAWAGKRVWLKIGGVKSCGWFWVNDKQVALNENYCATCKYEITDLVTPGSNATIVAQVTNLRPSRKGLMSAMHRWGGIYRDVELEATPQTFIDDAWVRGDFDAQCAEAHVEVAGRQSGDCKVRFTIDGRSVSSPAAADGVETVIRLPLPSFRPWSPEHPNLYTGVVELVENGMVVHRRRERFGVRKFEVRGKEFYLNDRPFFVRGFGDDHVYPITGITPPDRDLHHVHLAKAREAGFNYVRLHTHCELPEYFEAADELGIMVQPELPYYSDAPTEAFEFDPVRDVTELWRHYRRYPSFAVYSMGNEGSFGPVLDRRLHAYVKAMDPDRLKINQDCHEPWINPPEAADYLGGPVKPWSRGSVNPERPFVAHEYLNLSVKCDSRDEAKYTGVWQPPATRKARADWLAKSGLGMEWGDRLQNAQHALQREWQKRGIEAARSDPYCDGYIFWTIADVVVDQNGIYTAQGLFNPFWETKRGGFTPAEFARFNSPSCILLDIPGDNRVFTEGDEVDVEFAVAHYGEAPLPPDAALAWRLEFEGVVPSTATAASGICHVQLASKSPYPAHIVFPSVAKPAKATLIAAIEGVDTNSWDFWVFPRRAIHDGGDMAVAPSLAEALSRLYTGFAVFGTPEAEHAAVVVAEAGSAEAEDALAAGRRVVAIGKAEGVPNVNLGWWFMGDQVGTALRDHPVFGNLPHEGVLSPLLFRIVGKGMPLEGVGIPEGDLFMVGEGGKGCFGYLFQRRTANGGTAIESVGLDLLSGNPEAVCILDGMIEYARNGNTHE